MIAKKCLGEGAARTEAAARLPPSLVYSSYLQRKLVVRSIVGAALNAAVPTI